MSTYDMLKVGDVIAGKYRLDKVAGEGGMGVVYAATHLVLKQTVAVRCSCLPLRPPKRGRRTVRPRSASGGTHPERARGTRHGRGLTPRAARRSS